MILFQLNFFVSALPASNSIMPPSPLNRLQLIGHADIPRNDTTSELTYGQYHIENCRAYFPHLTEVIDSALAAVRPALDDVKLGEASRHGFRALFKYHGAREYVAEMLKAISTMRPQRALEPWPLLPTQPQFSCVIRNSKNLYPFLEIDPWQLCSFSPLAAFYAPESSFIFLCPRFFSYPGIPTDLSGRNCPGVQDNQWVHNSRNLYNYQTYILLHEMVHFYLQSHSLSGTTIPPEQYGIDGCVALDPLHSLHNPTNYQVYVASKSESVLTLVEDVSNSLLEVVDHGCTQAPDPYKPPYLEPNGEVAIVPGLNITYMNEQLPRNMTGLGTPGDGSSTLASVATA